MILFNNNFDNEIIFVSGFIGDFKLSSLINLISPHYNFIVFLIQNRLGTFLQEILQVKTPKYERAHNANVVTTWLEQNIGGANVISIPSQQDQRAGCMPFLMPYPPYRQIYLRSHDSWYQFTAYLLIWIFYKELSKRVDSFDEIKKKKI